MRYKPYKSRRLSGHDYSSAAMYFVTGVVQDRVRCLGEVSCGEMMPSKYGFIVQQRWDWLAEHYPYVKLHAFVVMPDHFHGIIEICHTVPSGDFVSVKIKSLSELMGAFKTTSSKHIHLAGLMEFEWQRSFHDRIIRNEGAYQRIKRYVRINPARWKG